MSEPDQQSVEASARPPDEEEQENASAISPAAADPQAFKLRGDPPRVMRLSRKALASFGAMASLSIGGALIYALQPAGHEQAVNLVDTQSRARAESMTRAPRDYSEVPQLGQAMPGDLGRPILSAQHKGQAVPVSAMGTSSASATDPRIVQAEQARQRIMQEHDSARTSRLFLGGPSGGRQLTGPGPVATSNLESQPPERKAAPPSAADFMTVATNRSTVSSERITAPASRSILQAGSVIPAALLTGIQSDLPGQITAQVTQNVYDSPTGKILLIPQGSRLIGEYDSEVSTGQSRVLLAWDRLILPGGRSILLDRQPGADASGTAGLKDGVNHHWGKMLKAALISTLLGVGTELATDSDDALVEALRYGTQDTVNQTGRQVVQREIRVPPTLTVRPGYVLRVLVTCDLILEPVLGYPE